MRTLFNQIKLEMEITQMKERVLVYVAEKQSVEESKILIDVSIALVEQQGDIVVAVVTELSDKNYMSEEAFMTVASIVDDFEVDKVVVLVPDMIHENKEEIELRNLFLSTLDAEFSTVFCHLVQEKESKNIIIPFPVKKAVRNRPEHITATTFRR